MVAGGTVPGSAHMAHLMRKMRKLVSVLSCDSLVNHQWRSPALTSPWKPAMKQAASSFCSG